MNVKPVDYVSDHILCKPFLWIVLLRYTSTVNGYSAIAVTKLDILDELDEIKIGVKYMKDGKELNYFPSSIQVDPSILMLKFF